MRILYLQGFLGQPGGTKVTFLREHGHEVIEPDLPPYKFDASVDIAQRELQTQHPDMVVGVSRGGAVAMNIESGQAPLVLIAPAWNWNGMAKKVKAGTMILHSAHDEVVPLEHSRQLIRNSELPPNHLVIIGEDHRMIDPAALEALLRAVEGAAGVEKRC